MCSALARPLAVTPWRTWVRYTWGRLDTVRVVWYESVLILRPAKEPGTPRKTATSPPDSPTYQALWTANQPPSRPMIRSGRTIAVMISSRVPGGRRGNGGGASSAGGRGGAAGAERRPGAPFGP